MKVMGNATTYIGGTTGRPLPRVPDTHRRAAHKPWCIDCKKKHDTDQLDSDGRCAKCAQLAVRRAEAADRRAEHEAAFNAAVKATAAAERATAEAKKATPPKKATPAPARVPRPTPAPTTELPQAGNPGQPTTRPSAPRATSSSGTSGRAPDAGSANHREKNPPAAPETRPAAAGGPPTPTPTRDQALNDQLQHVERVLTHAAAVPSDPIVGMLRTSVLASIEALHVYLELHHHTQTPTSARGADGKPPAAVVAGQTSPGPRIPRPGGGQPAADAADPPARQPADTFKTFQKPRRRSARRPTADVDEQAICREYKAGDSRPTVARRHGVLPKRITQILQAHRIEIRDDRRGHSGGTPRVYDPATIAAVTTRYSNGETIADIADALHIGRRQTTRILREAGWDIRPPAHIGTATVLTDNQKTEAVQQYLDGATLADVAHAYHVRASTVRDMVVAAGHQPRSKGDTFTQRARRVAALGVSPLDIKQWGVDQGLADTITRGHVPGPVLDAYEAAHPTKGATP